MKQINSYFTIIMAFFLTSFLNACAQPSNSADLSKNKVTASSLVFKTDAEWKKILTAEQYSILREKNTERPYTGKWLNNKEKGTYSCAGCGYELFTSDMKFDSHCGWPSFDKEIAGGRIIKVQDNSLGMRRTEIVCAQCGGHLGHLFDDGPTETGMRYCVNSASIDFDKETKKPLVQQNNVDTITLGGGCYWCVEAVYERLNGVMSVTSGFSGGKVANPSYREVCMETTGHAEVVQVVFDKNKISLDEILKVFFTVHDPTTLNQQGADVGEQYRSVIFFRNVQQQQTATSIIAQLNKNKVYDRPVVTAVEPFKSFYKAEDDHQNYYDLNKSKPYCRMVIQPKIEKFEKLFKDRLKKNTQ